MPDVQQLFPVLAVRNLEEAIEFYCGGLGFVEAWRFGEPPHRAGVRAGAVELHLDAGGLGATAGAAVYCHLKGIDEYFAACVRRGVKLTRGLAARPWGVRDFQVADPSGNMIGFAELLQSG